MMFCDPRQNGIDAAKRYLIAQDRKRDHDYNDTLFGLLMMSWFLFIAIIGSYGKWRGWW